MFTKIFEGLAAMFEESRSREAEVKNACLDRAEALTNQAINLLKKIMIKE